MFKVDMFVRDSYPLFTVDWHQRGLENFDWSVIATEPDDAEDIKQLCVKLHWANYNCWHFEDYCRSGIDAQIIRCKPQIDKYNQLRNDFIEKIDEYLISEQTDTGSYTIETLGSIIDRISIMALKVYHWSELVAAGNKKYAIKLAIAHDQYLFLTTGLADLLLDMRLGRRRMRLFRQLKMYNDPNTNQHMQQPAQ